MSDTQPIKSTHEEYAEALVARNHYASTESKHLFFQAAMLRSMARALDRIETELGTAPTLDVDQP